MTFTFSRTIGIRRRLLPGTSAPHGGMPQAWNPETGAISALPGAVRKGPLTSVPIQLEPHESLFVVFRDGPAPANSAAGSGGSAAGLAKPCRCRGM